MRRDERDRNERVAGEKGGHVMQAISRMEKRATMRVESVPGFFEIIILGGDALKKTCVWVCIHACLASVHACARVQNCACVTQILWATYPRTAGK